MNDFKFLVKKNQQFFGLQNCVKFILFEVLLYIWYQNNQKYDHLSENNPSVWYTWQHFRTMIGHVQPCFGPWTGRFSHNTHHMTMVQTKIFMQFLKTNFYFAEWGCHWYNVLLQQPCTDADRVLLSYLAAELYVSGSMLHHKI